MFSKDKICVVRLFLHLEHVFGREIPRPATADNLLKVIDDSHDLLKWLIPVLDKFPRTRRFTLGERLEPSLPDVLEECVGAAYGQRNFLKGPATVLSRNCAVHSGVRPT